jgi:putative two-component system response regulator
MAAAEATGYRIVVAEDDPSSSRFFHRVLAADGHDVRLAADGVEALKLICEFKPDLILLDLYMPRLDGREVCRRVKQDPATRLIPIVIVTAADNFDLKMGAWEVGADDFLGKPLHGVELVARCRSLLRVKSLIDELDTAEAVVFALARAVEAKSPYTQGHAERVTLYALALSDEVGVSAEDRETLRKGALLHDIGKISVPDAILDKPGPLTAEEHEVVKQHPVQGARIIEPLRSLRETVPLIRWHHERPDGGGYPDGLRGGDIGRLVRVLSIADVYDSLASKRPYRGPLSPADCLGLLRQTAAQGGLDADLVDAFCALMDGGPQAAPAPRSAGLVPAV